MFFCALPFFPIFRIVWLKMGQRANTASRLANLAKIAPRWEILHSLGATAKHKSPRSKEQQRELWHFTALTQTLADDCWAEHWMVAWEQAQAGPIFGVHGQNRCGWTYSRMFDSRSFLPPPASSRQVCFDSITSQLNRIARRPIACSKKIRQKNFQPDNRAGEVRICLDS